MKSTVLPLKFHKWPKSADVMAVSHPKNAEYTALSTKLSIFLLLLIIEQKSYFDESLHFHKPKCRILNSKHKPNANATKLPSPQLHSLKAILICGQKHKDSKYHKTAFPHEKYPSNPLPKTGNDKLIDDNNDIRLIF